MFTLVDEHFVQNCAAKKKAAMRGLNRDEANEYWAKEFQAGNRDGLENILYININGLVRMANKLGRDRDCRDDLIQEGILGIQKGLSKFDFSHKIKVWTYLFNAARFSMIGFLRLQTRRDNKQISLDLIDGETFLDKEEDFHNDFKEFAILLNRIPLEIKRLLILHYGHGIKWTKIDMKYTRQRVNQYVHQLRRDADKMRLIRGI